VVVLGPKLKREIFGEANALGEFVRIGGQRFHVIGLMAPKGLLLGFDIDDSAYIPVATARSLFNEDGLIEIDVTFSENFDLDRLVADVRSLMIERHDGEDDVTITTQTEMLDVFGRIMDVVSAAAGGGSGSRAGVTRRVGTRSSRAAEARVLLSDRTRRRQDAVGRIGLLRRVGTLLWLRDRCNRAILLCAPAVFRIFIRTEGLYPWHDRSQASAARTHRSVKRSPRAVVPRAPGPNDRPRHPPSRLDRSFVPHAKPRT